MAAQDTFSRLTRPWKANCLIAFFACILIVGAKAQSEDADFVRQLAAARSESEYYFLYLKTLDASFPNKEGDLIRLSDIFHESVKSKQLLSASWAGLCMGNLFVNIWGNTDSLLYYNTFVRQMSKENQLYVAWGTSNYNIYFYSGDGSLKKELLAETETCHRNAPGHLLDYYFFRLKYWEALRLGNISDAIQFANELIVASAGNTNRVIKSWIDLGVVYADSEQWDKAIDCYLNVKKISEVSGEGGFYYLCLIAGNLADIYSKLKRDREAIEMILPTLKICEKIQEARILGWNSFQLANAYTNLDMLDSAALYAASARRIAKQTIDNGLSGLGCELLGRISLRRGRLKDALLYLEEGVEYSRKGNPAYYLARALSLYAEALLKNGQETAGLKNLAEADSIFGSLRNWYDRSLSMKEVSSHFEKKGDMAKAFHYYRLASQYSDSLFASDKNKAILELEEKYKLGQKEGELLRLAQEKQLAEEVVQRSRYLIGMLVALLALVLMAAYFVSQHRKIKLSLLLMDTHNDLLQQQIKPHFIFNALNSIQSVLMDGDTKTSLTLMNKFGKLMRLILENSGKQFSTIGQELDILRLYMDIEQFRTNWKFEYQINIDPEIEIDHEEIPSMVMQIFVENAIWHGIAPSPSPGVIQLSFAKHNGQLVCAVEDNGVGCNRSLSLKTRDNILHHSRGLGLVKERIHVLNKILNKNIRFSMEDISNTVNYRNGTRVTLTV